MCQELANQVAANQNKLAEIVIAIVNKEVKTVPRTTQITNAKPPPSWVGQDYMKDLRRKLGIGKITTKIRLRQSTEIFLRV